MYAYKKRGKGEGRGLIGKTITNKIVGALGKLENKNRREVASCASVKSCWRSSRNNGCILSEFLYIFLVFVHFTILMLIHGLY